MIVKRTEEELEQIALDRLSYTQISTNGNRALSIIKAINSIFLQVYDDIELSVSGKYLSTAVNEELDLIGEDRNCFREPNESDEDYRYRIVQTLGSKISGTLDSITQSLSSLEFVSDIIIRPYTLGVGSFSVYVIPSSIVSLDSAIGSIETVLSSTIPCGIRYTVEGPTIKKIKMDVYLIFRPEISASQQTAIKRDIRTTIKTSIDSSKISEPIYLSSIITTCMNAYPGILDMQIYNVTSDNSSIISGSISLGEFDKAYVESITSINVI